MAALGLKTVEAAIRLTVGPDSAKKVFIRTATVAFLTTLIPTLFSWLLMKSNI